MNRQQLQDLVKDVRTPKQKVMDHQDEWDRLSSLALVETNMDNLLLIREQKDKLSNTIVNLIKNDK